MGKYELAKKFNLDGDHHIRTAIRKIYNSLYWVKFGKFRHFSDDEILNEFAEIKEYITLTFSKRFID